MCLDSTILASNRKQKHTRNVRLRFSNCLGKEINYHAYTIDRCDSMADIDLFIQVLQLKKTCFSRQPIDCLIKLLSESYYSINKPITNQKSSQIKLKVH